MSTRRVKLADIQVLNRHRQDLGDLAELERSIKQFGLLHPVVVTPELVLVAGERRMAAVKNMGLDEIPVTVCTTMADAADLLRAERDENTCRKDFTPSEFVALGKALETLERPKAKERQRLHAGTAPNTPADSAGVSDGAVRDIVASAVGVGRTRYAEAEYVVDATDDPDPLVSSTAEVARDEMDETGRVNSAFKKVKEVKERDLPKRERQQQADKSKAAVLARRDRIRSLAEQNYSSRQIAEMVGIAEDTLRNILREQNIIVPADAHVAGTRRIDPARVMNNTTTSLEGLVFSLDLIKPDDLVGCPEVHDWVISLDNSLQFLNRFRKQLKEMTQ